MYRPVGRPCGEGGARHCHRGQGRGTVHIGRCLHGRGGVGCRWGEVERGGARRTCPRGPAVSDEVAGRQRGCCCDGVCGVRDGTSLPMPRANARRRQGRGRSGQGRCRGVVPTAAAASWRYDDPGSARGGRACTCGGGRDRGNDTTTNLLVSSIRNNISAAKTRRGGKDVMVCEDCGVALCVRCWRAFHTKEVFKIEDYCKVVSENN